MKLYYEKIFRVYLLMSSYYKLTQMKMEIHIFQIFLSQPYWIIIKSKKSCKFLSLQR